MGVTQDIDPVNIVVIAGVAVVLWCAFQVGSRKQQALRMKIRRIAIGIPVYLAATYVFLHQALPLVEAVLVALLVALASAWLLVRPPKRDRRIPKGIRKQVIARDLTSQGVKWDAAKHHIDHTVPYSRGGDHSMRNLRVVEKQRNLRKGGKMPGLFDFFRK